MRHLKGAAGFLLSLPLIKSPCVLVVHTVALGAMPRAVSLSRSGSVWVLHAAALCDREWEGRGEGQVIFRYSLQWQQQQGVSAPIVVSALLDSALRLGGADTTWQSWLNELGGAKEAGG